MAVADGPGGVVTLKVVYYGPAGAGKTTNLERVSALIFGQASGRITPRRFHPATSARTRPIVIRPADASCATHRRSA